MSPCPLVWLGRAGQHQFLPEKWQKMPGTAQGGGEGMREGGEGSVVGAVRWDHQRHSWVDARSSWRFFPAWEILWFRDLPHAQSSHGGFSFSSQGRILCEISSGRVWSSLGQWKCNGMSFRVPSSSNHSEISRSPLIQNDPHLQTFQRAKQEGSCWSWWNIHLHHPLCVVLSLFWVWMSVTNKWQIRPPHGLGCCWASSFLKNQPHDTGHGEMLLNTHSREPGHQLFSAGWDWCSHTNQQVKNMRGEKIFFEPFLCKL